MHGTMLIFTPDDQELSQTAYNRPPTLAPTGTCPWGWTSSGSYCLRSGSVRRD
jgi:hypothetical protein